MQLTFLSYLLSLLTKIIDYVIGFFSSREICRKPTGQNTAGSFLINFTSHAIKRRQHSIDRDADLHVVIECLKKNADTLRSKQENNHGNLEIILKLLSSRQHEQRAGIIPKESLRVTQHMLVLRSSAQKCSMAVSDDNNTILILFSGY